MDFLDHILPASEHHFTIHSVRETGFVVHASARPIVAVREVRDYEPSSPQFCDYLVVYLVEVFLPINAERLISCILDSWLYGRLPNVVHRFIEPHRNERFRRFLSALFEFGKLGVSPDCNAVFWKYSVLVSVCSLYPFASLEVFQ